MKQNVTLELPSGQVISVQLPADVIVGRLLPALCSKLALPLVDESGQALRYKLVTAEGPLDSEQTLAAAAVAPDSELQLVSSLQRWELPVAEPRPRSKSGPPVIRLTEADIDASLVTEPSAPAGWWNPLTVTGAVFLMVIIGFLGFSAISPGGAFYDGGDPAVTAVRDPVISFAAGLGSVHDIWPDTSLWPDILAMGQTGESLFLLQKGDRENLLWQITPDASPRLLHRLTQYRSREQNSLTIRNGIVYFWDGEERTLWRFVTVQERSGPVGSMGSAAGHVPLLANLFYVYSGRHAGAHPLFASETMLQPGERLPVRVSSAWYQDSVLSGGYRYFIGFEPATGYELWRTDGTPAGTKLVHDIFAGPASSHPQQLVVAGDDIYFVATDATHGMELWRTHGPSGATELVADLHDYQNAKLAHLTVVGNWLFFTGTRGDRTHQLWRYDLVEQRLSLFDSAAYDISSAENQIGSNENAFYFLAADSGNLGQFALPDQHYRWILASADSIHWTELYVSPTQLLLVDAQGQLYQYLQGATAAVAVPGIDTLADVVPLSDGDFLLVAEQTGIWRLSPGPVVRSVVQLDELEAGDG
ncbi:MAG: hypothetical protein KDE34_03205 [Anaerolineales bacterium]|nr:hypothetical protein [Anaerolineales bacterium]